MRALDQQEVPSDDPPRFPAAGVVLLGRVGDAGAPSSVRAPALGAARWQLSSRAAPTNLAPGGEGLINVAADDLGTVGVSGAATPITITDVLPVGLKVTDASAIDPRWARSQSVEEKAETWKCSVAEERIVTCTTSLSPPPYERLEVEIPVKVNEPPGTETSLANEVTVHGGRTPRRSSGPCRHADTQLSGSAVRPSRSASKKAAMRSPPKTKTDRRTRRPARIPSS